MLKKSSLIAALPGGFLLAHSVTPNFVTEMLTNRLTIGGKASYYRYIKKSTGVKAMLYEVLEAIGQTPTEETIAAWIMDIVEDTLNYEIDSDYGNDYETWATEEKGQPLQIVTRPRYAKTLFEDFSECCLFELEGANPTAWEDSLEDTQFESNIATIKYHWLRLDWLKVWECLDKTKISVYKLI